LRGLEFVTRKITNAVARIKLGLQKELVLGNLEAKRDWGFAPEFVEAMWLMLQQDKPDDYVIATGETHSVKEFVDAAFASVDLDPSKYVKTSDMLKRPHDVLLLCGDPTKAQKNLKWQSKTKFSELVSLMVKEDLVRWQAITEGKSFPWDAPCYPPEKTVLKRHAK
jgi:GDPmannose 4,6-dehydratase